MKFKLTPLEKKWVYDVANSAFTLLVSTIMPIYFNYLAGMEGCLLWITWHIGGMHLFGDHSGGRFGPHLGDIVRPAGRETVLSGV